MEKGKIKFLSREGYGFIIPEDGSTEIYFNVSSFEDQEETKNLLQNDEVEFEIGQGRRGRKAINIKKVEKGGGEE